MCAIAPGLVWAAGRRQQHHPQPVDRPSATPLAPCEPLWTYPPWECQVAVAPVGEGEVGAEGVACGHQQRTPVAWLHPTLTRLCAPPMTLGPYGQRTCLREAAPVPALDARSVSCLTPSSPLTLSPLPLSPASLPCLSLLPLSPASLPCLSPLPLPCLSPASPLPLPCPSPASPLLPCYLPGGVQSVSWSGG